jgi:hypothetical protein
MKQVKIPIDTVIKLGYIYYVIVLVTHILILLGTIPYQWVNGGRSASFETQAQLSYMSMFIALIGLIYIFLTDRIKSLRYNIVFRIFTWLLTAYWTLGFFMQLLGTPFERFVLSFVLLFGSWIHARIALAKRPQQMQSAE